MVDLHLVVEMDKVVVSAVGVVESLKNLHLGQHRVVEQLLEERKLEVGGKVEFLNMVQVVVEAMSMVAGLGDSHNTVFLCSLYNMLVVEPEKKQ